MKYIATIILIGVVGIIAYTQFMNTPNQTGMKNEVIDRQDTMGDANYNNTRSNRSTSEAPDSESGDNAISDTTTVQPATNVDDNANAAADAEVTAELDATVATDESTVREFTIDSFNYGYSLDTITVNQGDTVTITLTNSDGYHDLVIDELAVATKKIRAGETTRVTFVADRAGTFEYYCSVGNHRAQGMVGILIVE